MSAPARSIADTRHEQRFPTFEAREIELLRRFGETRHFAVGEYLAKTGESSLGMFVILDGEVEVSQHYGFGPHRYIITDGPGQFSGELSQLSGRPALVDVVAMGAVEVLVIFPDRLRDLLVAEAELGERIMRALILRRVGLLETGGGGPILIGRADNRDVLRLGGFLSRNGLPHRWLDPDTDADARTLIERFHITCVELPIVLCPAGQLLHNPSEGELARCIGMAESPDLSRRDSRAGKGVSNLQTMLMGRSPSADSSITRSQARYAAPFLGRTESWNCRPIGRTLQLSPAAARVGPGAVLRLPMEAPRADRVVVIRDAVVVALALVERHKQQFGLPAGQWQHPGLERRKACCCQPTDRRERLTCAISCVQAQRRVFEPGYGVGAQAAACL